MSDVDIPVLGVDALVQPMLILITGSNTGTVFFLDGECNKPIVSHRELFRCLCAVPHSHHRVRTWSALLRTI